MTAEILIDVLDIQAGDAFRWRGEWLDVFTVNVVTINDYPVQIRILTDDDREFLATPGARRRIRRENQP